MATLSTHAVQSLLLAISEPTRGNSAKATIEAPGGSLTTADKHSLRVMIGHKGDADKIISIIEAGTGSATLSAVQKQALRNALSSTKAGNEIIAALA